MPCFPLCEAGLFCPSFTDDFFIANNGGTKRAALMIWENCEVQRSNFVILDIQAWTI
jgi:hypothetical protein